TLKRAKKARPYARNLLSEMNRIGKTPKETIWTFSNYSAFFTEKELRLMAAMTCEDHLDYEKPVKILLDPEQSVRPEELATSITLSLEHYRQHLESIAHPVRGKNSPHEKSLARLQQKVLLSQIYASESVRAFASFFGMNPDSTVNTLKKKLTRLMHLEEAINARLDLLAELLDLRAKITAEGGITLKILGESTNLLDRLGDLLKQNDPQDEIQNQPMILFYMMLFLEKHGLKQNELTGMERLPDEIKKRLIETLLFKMAV
ncbi:MAG: hypothetical protein JW774_03120, partial [Candidatus Aureabacteria bacterium]|nr:hypothetical protein [Candidatus Auribacterota bacterium]